MPLASGLAGQLGIAEEVTYGTYVAPTRFLEFNSESLGLDRERIESAGIRAGRRVLHRWAGGAQRSSGDLVIEASGAAHALLWKHILGAVNTTGSGPYTHTCTPGDLAGKSLTIQIGKPDIGGTVRPFSYLGSKIATAELAAAVNEYATLTLGIYAAHEDTGQSLGVASYPAALAPFVFTAGAVTLAGSAFDVREFRVSIDNGLATDRHHIRATTPERPKEPLERARRRITGTLTADFTDLTAYNRFVNGTEAALVLDLNGGASNRITATLNVRFDGETPKVSGEELLEQPLPFVATSATSDAAAITVAVINAEATP